MASKQCTACGNMHAGSGELCVTCRKRRRNQEAEGETQAPADAPTQRPDGRRKSITRRTSRRMSSSSSGTASSQKALEVVLEAEEILKHSSRKSLWVVIDGLVYDVTSFQKQHPGGAAVLLQWGGRDASVAAKAAHNGKTKPAQLMREMLVGVFEGEAADLMDQRGGRPDAAKMPILDLSALSAAAGAVPYAAPPPPPVMSYEESVPTLTNESRGSTSESETNNEVASTYSLGGGDFDVDVETFEELRLEPEVISEVVRVWEAFLRTQGTKEQAGEAVYNALFEGAPSLQALFTTPRAVQAMRFTTELHLMVSLLSQPKALKDEVESLGFGHLNLDVTVPRVIIFRDSILELFEIELGEELSEMGKFGWLNFLNYIGGAVIYIKTFYHERLNVLDSSWKKATDPDYNRDRSRADNLKASQRRTSQTSDDADSGDGSREPAEVYEDIPRKASSRFNRLFNRSQKSTARADSNSNLGGGGDGPHTEVSMGGIGNTIVVRTFQAMFDFNSAVMGLSSNQWLKEIVQSFDNIVTNISNTGRVQEECDVLVLKIATCTTGDIHLGDFKSCMLATLRSLLPKEWDSAHEVAWNWLWDNVERMIRASLGKPREWLRALRGMLEELDEVTKHQIRMRIYAKFFVVAQAGQDYFKQSDTRLHFIAERIIMMTVELFEDPHRMVDDISALGLRHVGYGIPTELFNPFVSVSVEVLKEFADNQLGNEAFRWSLSLISKMLVRTITEGSTIVMKAINANSVPQLRRAMAVAPRASRAGWLLRVEAGTQNISPLMWSIESGRVETAEAIIQDLLTIRADRDRYYYGVEDLFNRHRDIIKRLLNDAPSLLVLLQGLVWRSRISSHGMRRVNYYVKFLLINPEDNSVSETLSWLVAAKNPQTMSHEVVVLVSDTMWNGLIYRQFIYSKIWFMISLLFFMLGQAILPKSDSKDELPARLGILLSRLLIYGVTMCRLLYTHSKFCIRAYQEGETMYCLRCLKIPSYLRDPRDSGGFLLMLLLMMMCALDPLFHCLPEISDFPSYDCPEAETLSWEYSVFCMGAMAIHWLLLVDISVFSTGLSAFVLVIGQVLSEMTRFLITLVWLLLTFGSAISVLEHPYFEMRDIPNTAIALFSITIRLYEDDYRNMLSEPALLATVFVFVTASAVVLLNLLIAQINCSYVYIYQDMVGFARLNRADVICETLEKATASTWLNFVDTLQLDVPLEFNEGDVGLAGGIQVLEPSGLHPVTQDSILRFGGSNALEMPWPEDHGHHEDEDKYHRISKMLRSVLKNVGKSTKAKKQQVMAEKHDSVSSDSVMSGSSLEQGSSSAHS